MANPSFVFIFIMSLLFRDDSGISSDDESISDEATSSVKASAENLSDEATSSISTVSFSQAITTEADSGDLFAAGLVNYDDDGGVSRDGDDSDEDCYADEEDLDDELIQRSVRKKLKKQRLCKLGKRTVAKIPYTQLRRGCCIYGKHSLGIRFRC